MWQPSLLSCFIFSHLFIAFLGSSPVTGPKAVRGQERGSLAVQCRYTPGWESHGKWWCRGADWGNCKILVQTTASEPEVKRDRVSIRDDRENRTFTVTTEELRLDDAGIYWCGIARVGTDHAEQVSVTVDPGKSLGGRLDCKAQPIHRLVHPDTAPET
uniref:Ig-like domain-containing protein n=1 Tax=Sus scrofa TaxID=9823 RepID=A0A8D2A8C3_PIG